MAASRITSRASMVDTLGLGTPSTVAVFVVKGDKKTALIDCGYASSHENVIGGLRGLGVEPSNVDYVIPTHVHLDHAGATGHLIRRMTRATVVAHERAVPHLVDPTKLVESATTVFGEKAIQTFGRPLPVDSERISAVGAESHIDLGGATLTAIHAPGHAPHQISIVLEEEHLIFSADAVGIVYPGIPTMIPATPPPSFDPERLGETVERLRQVDSRKLLVPHFGVRTDVDFVLDRTGEATGRWVREVKKLNDARRSVDEIVAHLGREVTIKAELPANALPGYAEIQIKTSVLGILHYLNKASAQESPVRPS